MYSYILKINTFQIDKTGRFARGIVNYRVGVILGYTIYPI